MKYISLEEAQKQCKEIEIQKDKTGYWAKEYQTHISLDILTSSLTLTQDFTGIHYLFRNQENRFFEGGPCHLLRNQQEFSWDGKEPQKVSWGGKNAQKNMLAIEGVVAVGLNPVGLLLSIPITALISTDTAGIRTFCAYQLEVNFKNNFVENLLNNVDEPKGSRVLRTTII